MFKKAFVLSFLVSSSFSHADTLEDVVCYLRDEQPTCEFDSPKQNIQINLEAFGSSKQPTQIINIEPILKVDSSSEMSTRDKISLFLAGIGLLGFLLNSVVYLTQTKNRKEDKEGEKFNFWLKEIIYPNHIEPFLKDLSEVECAYNKWADASEQDLEKEQQRFMDAWPEQKVKLLEHLPAASSLPYLSNMFSQLREMILANDDYFWGEFSPPESLVFDVVVEEIEEIEEIEEQDTPKAPDRTRLSVLSQLIYKSINSEQNNTTKNKTSFFHFSKKKGSA
ncbi:hypothetical protein ACPUEJ_01470 [Vibrio tubiashii]|uniref:hypothetical protein n=1 Tax=Vibrio tubiashii TaxID=29498 RepID=UPI003CE5752E